MMVLTPSTMQNLGTEAPDFMLPDAVSGKTISLADVLGEKGLLVMFICRHCPYVQYIKEEIVKIGRDYSGKGLGILAINANDAKNYPEDAPDRLKEMAESLGFTFPFCYDETQETARAFSAACTPDFFLYDEDRKLVYRGQLDDSRPENGRPVDGKDLRAAMDALLEGRPVQEDQKPSIGCNIKWKEK